MPVLDQRGFYRLWAQKAFTPALRVTGLVSLVVGIVAAFLTARWPTLGALGMQLRWVLPVSAFTAFLVYRLFHGAFEILREVDARREAAEGELREKRKCQAIADMLTKEHHYGVHQLSNRPPTTPDEGKEWQRVVHNWNQGVLHRMREFGCTPQELNHVETITFGELTDVPDLPFTPQLRMHEIRLSRVVDVSTKYARRAEELMMRTPQNST